MTDGALRSSPPRRAADERRPACAPGGKRQVSLLAERGRTHGVECKRVDAPVLTPSGRIALADLKLERIVLSRASLRRLAEDPFAAIKIEYLQRELRRTSKRRGEFRYPREIRRGTTKRRAAAVKALTRLVSAL